MTPSISKSLMTLALVSCFAACSESGPDGWFIISNPSGNGLTAGVVKNSESSTMSLVQAPGGSDVFVLHDKQEGLLREQYYAVGSDFVLDKQAHALIVESPAFAEGRHRFPAGTQMELGRDAATLMKLREREQDGSVTATWWISGWGNLILEQRAEGLTIYREGHPPQVLGQGTEIRARGRSFEVADGRGRRHLLQPGHPPEPEQRMAYIEERKAVQFFDARGRVIAELPADGIEIAPQGQAFFLTGTYPQGLPGISDRPISVLVPRHNRHLILLTR